MEKSVTIPQLLEKQQYLKLPTHEREQYMREIIRQTVKLNPNGVRISVLAKHLPIDVKTISKYLAIMEYTNEVYSEKDGTHINYFPNSRLMHPASEQAFDLGHVEFQVYHLRNSRLGDSIFIQERKKDEYKDDIGSGIIIPVDKFKEFTQYLSKIAEEL
jgi:queuine/archaeosine tRNA-ribosyltransferase